MKNNRNKVLVLVILLLLLVCVFVGVSVSVFTYFGKGQTNNVIETGRIIFSYSDAVEKGNGINIENASFISDTEGKLLSNENEYFDFSVTASTTLTDLAYEIVVLKQDGSTLPDDYVKIYLTELNGAIEEEVPLMSGLVPTYYQLNDTSNELLNGKTMYYGTVKAGEVAYGKRFRLRMWLKQPEDSNFDESVLDDKSYIVKVNVAAIGAK